MEKSYGGELQKDSYLTKNFQASEIACPCCGDTSINMTVMAMAQAARDILEEPLYVPSGGGKRCLSYHVKNCGNYDSAHVHGHAIDLYRKPYQRTDRMIELAEVMQRVGFTRIGLYPSFGVRSVHGDIWTPAPSKSWVYDEEYIYFPTLKESIKYVKEKYSNG